MRFYIRLTMVLYVVLMTGGCGDIMPSPVYNSKVNRAVITPKPLIASDYFPPFYYPNKAHPRLWLTQERLQSIQYEKNHNTRRWRDFKEMCDAIIDSNSGNDPYGLDQSPQNFTAPLALMYIITGNSVYADKAIVLVEKTGTDLSQYGDPDHQSFYYLGLTYDWLYDYAGMTASKRASFRTKMRQLSDNFYNTLNLTASGTDSDQNLLTGNLHLTFGAAIYGDDNISAKVMLDRGWYGWTHGYYQGNRGISNRDIMQAGLGGVYFTGMAYFPSTDIIGIAGYTQTLKTACNYDIKMQEPKLHPFWSHIIKSMIYLTDPSRTLIEDYGSWQDPNRLSEQPWLRRALTISSYFAKEAGYARSVALARGYNDAVDLGYYNDYFLELFYNLPQQEGHNPYDSQYKLPPVYFAQNPDFLIYRDRWGTDGVWGVFRGDGSVPLDQQAPDHGSFSLWYKEGYLTKGARNYEALAYGDFFNTLSIQNGCTNNGISCSGTAIFDSQKSATIPRYREGNDKFLFAYGMLDADGQWNDNDDVYQPVQNVKTYRRHFFWTPRYVVLFDRVHTKVPLNVRYRLRAMTEPVISGSTIIQTTTAGNYKLLHRTLEPTNVVIRKVDEKVLWQGVADWIIDDSERHWQSYIDFNNTADVNILNVMQAGERTMTSFDTLEHINNIDSSGVRIGNWVVVFNKNEALRSYVRYTVHDLPAQSYHFIADLEPGVYTAKIEGTNTIKVIDTIASEKDNSVVFELENTLSGTQTIVVSKLNWIYW